MAISRGICAALVAALVASTAQAAIIGSATLVKNPAAVPFAAPEAALGAPWVSYNLSAASTAGELIGAVDVKIGGQLHQRWTDGDEDGVFDPTPNANSAASLTQGDSHLVAPTGALFGRGPTEDNSGAGSPLANTATRQYGVGTLLDGAWGIQNALNTASLAYIVIPAGSEPTIDIAVRIAAPNGDIIGDLDLGDFFVIDTNDPPVVGDKAVEYTSVHPSTIVSETLSLADPDGPPGTWSLDSFASPNGQAANVDPLTGLFTWLGNGTPEGVYNAVLKYTDGGGLSDTGTLAITWHVPEPTSFALLGLALVGFAGFRRK